MTMRKVEEKKEMRGKKVKGNDEGDNEINKRERRTPQSSMSWKLQQRDVSDNGGGFSCK
jgi:hypothetical protein